MGMQATGESLVAPLTFPVLNMLVNTAFPITYDRVQQVIDDAEVKSHLGLGQA